MRPRPEPKTMYHRNVNGGYQKNNYLSKSYDNHLHDYEVGSSSSYEDAVDRSFDVLDNLANQVRNLKKTASKSYSSGLPNSNGSFTSKDGGLTEEDVSQIEAFFRSHKTSVFVCRSLSNLYFGRGPNQWELARTGVPVLLLDEGDTRARSQRLLQIVLAEKGTGFVLWKDVINGRTNYRVQEPTFHVMFTSWDRSRTIGLRFDLVSAAMVFFEKLEQLIGDPRNLSLLSITTKKGKRRSQNPSGKKMKKELIRLPMKCEISKPCCFQHVTNVAIDDKDRLYTLATLVSNRH